MKINLDHIAKFISILTLAIATYAAWITAPLDAALKKLQIETTKTEHRLMMAESRLKDAESRLRETESARKLTFDLYQEVKNVLQNGGARERDEDALRVLIETLADDPFRSKLLDVLAAGASSELVQRAAEDSSTFFLEETMMSSESKSDEFVPNALGSESSAIPQQAPTLGHIGNYDVDVFYCTDDRANQEAMAERIAATKLPIENGRWRVRVLPDSINRQSGYRSEKIEIRYDGEQEIEVAEVLQARLKAIGVSASLRMTQTQNPTRWYISIFVCGKVTSAM